MFDSKCSKCSKKCQVKTRFWRRGNQQPY